MPPRRPSHPPPPPPHVPAPRPSASATTSPSTADIAKLLECLISDPEDREFVARCIATEGPPHHRLASFVILTLLSQVVEKSGVPVAAEHDGYKIPFRLPPHLDRHNDEDALYPLRLARGAMQRVALNDARRADMLASAVVDGPPHHALANVAMVNLLHALVSHLEAKETSR
ncbi:MAG: hypothetical protein IPK82_01290 [Polyangiaceae bacterium]|nr:hypothetical protein [Polyangiaceae bacterium]